MKIITTKFYLGQTVYAMYNNVQHTLKLKDYAYSLRNEPRFYCTLENGQTQVFAESELYSEKK